MRIAYFTTAQDKQEYLKSTIESNPSNQVFHSNFIECLSLTNELNVFVLRSNAYRNNNAFTNSNGKINWNYLQTKRGKISNLICQVSSSKKIKERFDVAFVDTMNARCLLSARAYSEKNKVPLIGIVTDNPYNITNGSKFKSELLLNTAKKCDGFVCLTVSLNNLFNINNKPYILIKGLNKNIDKDKCSPVNYQYFFYAGTLLKKYGILDLVDAFKKLNTSNIKLVIAGHCNNEDFQSAIKDDNKIVFLGNIGNDLVSQYENHSIANINPRPFMKEIDEYSIPSKVIEYSFKDSLIISGFSSQLIDVFKDSVLWIDKNNSLLKRLEETYNLNATARKENISIVNSISNNEFSFETVNKKLDSFIFNLIK